MAKKLAHQQVECSKCGRPFEEDSETLQECDCGAVTIIYSEMRFSSDPKYVLRPHPIQTHDFSPSPKQPHIPCRSEEGNDTADFQSSAPPQDDNGRRRRVNSF